MRETSNILQCITKWIVSENDQKLICCLHRKVESLVPSRNQMGKPGCAVCHCLETDSLTDHSLSQSILNDAVKTDSQAIFYVPLKNSKNTHCTLSNSWMLTIIISVSPLTPKIKWFDSADSWLRWGFKHFGWNRSWKYFSHHWLLWSVQLKIAGTGAVLQSIYHLHSHFWPITL